MCKILSKNILLRTGFSVIYPQQTEGMPVCWSHNNANPNVRSHAEPAEISNQVIERLGFSLRAHSKLVHWVFQFILFVLVTCRVIGTKEVRDQTRWPTWNLFSSFSKKRRRGNMIQNAFFTPFESCSFLVLELGQCKLKLILGGYWDRQISDGIGRRPKFFRCFYKGIPV